MLFSLLGEMRDTQGGPVIPRAQHPAPREAPSSQEAPSSGSTAVGVPWSWFRQCCCPAPGCPGEIPTLLPSPQAESLPERSTQLLNAEPLLLCINWQPSRPGQPQLVETLCVHPSPPSSDDHLEYWQQRERAPSHGV